MLWPLVLSRSCWPCKRSMSLSCFVHACSSVIPERGWSLIARFTGPTWGPSGADRTQVGSMLASWTLLSGIFLKWKQIGVTAETRRSSWKPLVNIICLGTDILEISWHHILIPSRFVAVTCKLKLHLIVHMGFYLASLCVSKPPALSTWLKRAFQ